MNGDEKPEPGNGQERPNRFPGRGQEDDRGTSEERDGTDDHRDQLTPPDPASDAERRTQKAKADRHAHPSSTPPSAWHGQIAMKTGYRTASNKYR